MENRLATFEMPKCEAPSTIIIYFNSTIDIDKLPWCKKIGQQCMHGGKCVSNRGKGKYHCQCKRKFTGELCGTTSSLKYEILKQ